MNAPAAPKRHRSAARQRILETAERLFYREGVRAVGIDRIIAEAGVAKMTLYNHFASKDDLILAVLQYREEKFDGFFNGWVEDSVRGGADHLTAFFAALKRWFESPDFRGCAFINATVELADAEHAGSRFSAAHKERFHRMLAGILTEAAGPAAQAVVPAAALLVEGAIIAALMQGNSAPADTAREAVITLVAAAKAGGSAA
jgi:AcrR family transcriptional regulator